MPINENHWKIVFNRLNLRLKTINVWLLKNQMKQDWKTELNFRCENFEYFSSGSQKTISSWVEMWRFRRAEMWRPLDVLRFLQRIPANFWQLEFHRSQLAWKFPEIMTKSWLLKTICLEKETLCLSNRIFYIHCPSPFPRIRELEINWHRGLSFSEFQSRS